MIYEISIQDSGSYESKEGQTLEQAAKDIATFLVEQQWGAPRVDAVYKWTGNNNVELSPMTCGYVEGMIEDFISDMEVA
jgi:hypothetical protein